MGDPKAEHPIFGTEGTIVNPLVLRFMRLVTRLCRERGLDEQLIDFESFYDFGMSWHENKRLLVMRINSLARRFAGGEVRRMIERWNDYRCDPRNNPNSLLRFIRGE
jgi:hypothetical protein